MSDGAEQARFGRPPGLEGLEVVRAHFVAHRYPRHVHEEWTLALIERGAARFVLGREELVVQAGEVAVIPPGTVHTGEPAGEDGYRYTAVHAHPELGVMRAAAGAAATPPAISRAGRPGIAAFRVLWHSVHATTDDPAAEALVALTRLAPELGIADAGPRSLPRPVVERACALLRERRSERTPLPALAAAVGATPHALIRAFGQDLGITPHRYQLAVRIAHARRLLRGGEPIAQVAASCGFTDQAHLTRTFREILGLPPGAYVRHLSAA